jgi:hypothetical protein
MGFAAGLQAGMAAAERGLSAYDKARQQREFEAVQNATASELQDYTPSQTSQIQGLQGTDAYDVQAIPGAQGTAPTLRYTPKQGLDLQGDMPAAPLDVAPQRMTQFLGQRYEGELTPERMQGLRYQAMADVVAKQDPVRAMQMRQEALRMEREAARAPLELEQLRGSIAGQRQQQDLTGLQLKAAGRTEAEQQRATDFSNFAAENPNATAADLKKAAFEQFKFTPAQWQNAVNTRLGISDTEQKLFVSGVRDKLKGKNLQQLGSLYNSDPDFDDKTDLAIVPGKGGAVTLNFIDKASGRVTSTQSFKNEALATEYLNKQATEPENIGSWILNLRKAESGIEAQTASAAKDRALGGLYAQGGAGAGKGTLKQKVADFKEVYGRDPSEAEKGILAGLTNKPREFTAADVNARAKLMVDGGMMDPDDPKKPLSPQKAIQMAEAELSGQPFVSPVDKLIADMAKARAAAQGNAPSTQPPASSPAVSVATPLRGPAVLGPDPNRLRTSVNPVTGLTRETPASAPNLIEAAGRGLDAGAARYKLYLESKIDSGQPLTADERIRATRLGLQQ